MTTTYFIIAAISGLIGGKIGYGLWEDVPPGNPISPWASRIIFMLSGLAGSFAISKTLDSTDINSVFIGSIVAGAAVGEVMKLARLRTKPTTN
jgi:hypothetical protein